MEAKIKNYMHHKYSEKEIFMTAETNPNHLPGMQYMKPLDEYIKYEEEPLSDKHIEALALLMRANRPFNSTNWTMLFMGILYIIIVFCLLLI